MSYYTKPHDPSEYGGGGSAGANYYDPNADFSQAISQAKYHKTGRYEEDIKPDEDDDEETSFFSRAVGFISEHKEKLGREEIDEEKAVGAHQVLYGEGGGGSGQTHDADSLGAGAAVQALKMFLAGGEGSHGGGGGGAGTGAGKHDQNKLIGIAMAQAGQLWDQQNQQGKATTDKQSAVNAAAKYALQLYVKGGAGGGLGTGGTGGMGGLAGKLALGSLTGGGGQGGAGLFGFAKKFM